jgi:hypothetical protein
VFILYAILVGLVVGYLAGGRLEGLALLDLRPAAIAIAIVGLLVQIAIFGPLADRVGPAGPLLYAGSTAVVLLAVLASLRVPGLPLVALGAASNLAAVVANGGVMPADPGALALAGLEADAGFSNSAVFAAPSLRLLTDIFALPAAFPFANVFSVGDVLIAVGIGIAIVAGMRRSDAVRTRNSYD